jgi:hypothetical protein
MKRNLSKLPKWAQQHIKELEGRIELVEKTLPWTERGMEWFTLFHPRFGPKDRAPERLFTCSSGGTNTVCTLGPNDCVFVGRGKQVDEP